MTVQEIKGAVRNLSAEQRTEIAAYLPSLSDDAWDQQVKRDLAAGKFDKILAEVDSDIAQDKTHGVP